VPIPEPVFGLARFGGGEYPAELRALLTYGRGVDTTRMRSMLGFEPRFTTADTVRDFADSVRPTVSRADRALATLESRLTGVPR
jgi:UDP-glucose 4-epimerase